MSVPKMNVKDITQYWEILSGNLSYLSRYLQDKAEYGSCVSERGVQRIVLFTAERLARESNMNVNLVSALCQAVALCFPERGAAELSVIKEYIKNNDMNVVLDTLEIDAIEYIISQSGSIITPELDMMLHHYYSNDESVCEVNLVRFLQKYLNLNRRLLCECSLSDSGQVVDEIMKRAGEEYKISYRLLPDPSIPPVFENIKREIEENLVQFIEFNKDIRTGIYDMMI